MIMLFACVLTDVISRVFAHNFKEISCIMWKNQLIFLRWSTSLKSAGAVAVRIEFRALTVVIFYTAIWPQASPMTLSFHSVSTVSAATNIQNCTHTDSSKCVTVKPGEKIKQQLSHIPSKVLYGFLTFKWRQRGIFGLLVLFFCQ